MKHAILFYCLLSGIISNAQRTLPEFGKVDKADLELKSCSFEPDANAMVLFDEYDVEVLYSPASYTRSYYSPATSELRTERRVRMKIFNEKGFKHASIRIPYFMRSKRTTKMKKISAIVYNLDPTGKIVSSKLEDDDFFKEKVKDKTGLLTFAFPNLKAGSVIEYRYTLIEKNTLSLDPWIIQSEIPVAYSFMKIQSPIIMTVKHYLLAADTINTTEQFIRSKFRSTSFFKEDIPSFRYETMMSSYKDHLARMVFSISPGNDAFTQMILNSERIWNTLGNRLRDALESDFKQPIPGTESLIDSAHKFKTSAEKIGFLYGALRKRFQNKSEQTFRPESLEEAWKTQSANSAEINLLLFSLLKRAGVDAHPMLISTRDNGRVNRNYPSISQFNGIDILAFDSVNYFLLDASIPYQSYLDPPLNVLNREAFLLSDSVQWVSVTDTRYLNRTNTAVFAGVSADGKLEGSVDARFFNYAKSYRMDSTLKEDNEEENKVKPVGLKILSVKTENSDKEGEPLVELIEFTYEPNNTGDFYFIKPTFLAQDNKNPFTQEKRSTDIDLGCNQQHVFTMNLQIPAGWELNSYPNNKIVRAPDSSFFFRRSVTASAANLFYTYTFEINRTIFDKEEYEGIKEFFKLIYSLMDEEIVLKKKK
jgi:Domain of Unknown Function with PDB structure (DUF3857)